MNKMTIAAVAVAAVLLVAGAYVVVSMGNGSDNQSGKGGDNNTQTDAVDSANKTLAVSFPVEISADNRKMALSMDYPGKGESGYSYNWSKNYQFNITASPASGYTGNVLIKMFAEKSGEIGTSNLVVKDFKGNQVQWSFATKNGAHTLYNEISGDIVSWKTNGTTSYRTIDVMFNGTGNFTLFIQAFDLNTGKAISDAVSATPLYVPVTGHLVVKALNVGEWKTTVNGTYYVILMNITNNWNIRYDVDATYLVLSNSTTENAANTTAMVFRSQSLAPSQSTQFQAFFDFTNQDRTSFVLQYRDGNTGEVMSVPLGNNTT
ncbi:MAG: hypothetical protein SA339_00820 [Methanomassiliicoccus sp.]|nr:hypothetical protein [Methanomassiliicoccus sp.]